MTAPASDAVGAAVKDALRDYLVGRVGAGASAEAPRRRTRPAACDTERTTRMPSAKAIVSAALKKIGSA